MRAPTGSMYPSIWIPREGARDKLLDISPSPPVLRSAGSDRRNVEGELTSQEALPPTQYIALRTPSPHAVQNLNCVPPHNQQGVIDGETAGIIIVFQAFQEEEAQGGAEDRPIQASGSLKGQTVVPS